MRWKIESRRDEREQRGVTALHWIHRSAGAAAGRDTGKRKHSRFDRDKTRTTTRLLVPAGSRTAGGVSPKTDVAGGILCLREGLNSDDPLGYDSPI